MITYTMFVRHGVPGSKQRYIRDTDPEPLPPSMVYIGRRLFNGKPMEYLRIQEQGPHTVDAIVEILQNSPMTHYYGRTFVRQDP